MISKRRAAARYGAARTPLPCREATVNIKRRFIFGVVEQRSAGRRWADYHILRSSPDFLELSPSPNHSPKNFQVQMNPENWKNAAFSQQKCPISFPLAQSKSCPDPKFWSALHSGSNPNSTKFAIVRIQSKSSPSLLRTHTCTPQSSENLVVTKVSLRKINNYQDHNRLQLEKTQNFAGSNVMIHYATKNFLCRGWDVFWIIFGHWIRMWRLVSPAVSIFQDIYNIIYIFL